MSQPILIKVYASLWPATANLEMQLVKATRAALPAAPEIELADSLLTISFEGIFFPLDDLIAEIEQYAFPGLQGKIDALDIENWVLRRYLVEDGEVCCHVAPLNNVLDYSGH